MTDYYKLLLILIRKFESNKKSVKQYTPLKKDNSINFNLDNTCISTWIFEVLGINCFIKTNCYHLYLVNNLFIYSFRGLVFNI